MSISSLYKNIPLKTEDKKLLTHEFVGFSTLLGIAFELSRQEFARLFLRPTLWKIVCIFLPLTTIIASFFVSVFGKELNEKSILLVLESISSKSSPDKINEYINWLIENHGTSTFIVCSALVIFSIFAALISYRTLFLFNDKQIESIWKTPNNFYLAFLKIVPVIFSLSIAQSLVDEFMKNSYGNFIINNTLALLFYGLLGLYNYFIVFEENSVNQSLTKSYLYSKPYFWKNATRWGLFYLLATVTSVCVILATLIWIIPMTTSNFNPFASIIFVVMLIFGIGCLLVIEFVSEVFGYISFLNLMLLNTEESAELEKVMAIEIAPE